MTERRRVPRVRTIAIGLAPASVALFGAVTASAAHTSPAPAAENPAAGKPGASPMPTRAHHAAELARAGAASEATHRRTVALERELAALRATLADVEKQSRALQQGQQLQTAQLQVPVQYASPQYAAPQWAAPAASAPAAAVPAVPAAPRAAAPAPPPVVQTPAPAPPPPAQTTTGASGVTH